MLRAVGIDVVPYLHGIGYEELASSNASWRFLIARILGQSSRVIVLGNAGEKDVSQWVRTDQQMVIPNTVPDEPTEVVPPKSGSRCRLVYISTLLRTKGAMEFVSAAREVLSHLPGAEFVLAGQSCDPAFDDELRAAAAAIGRTGSIQFLGPVYGTAKDRLLASSDVFVFPTRYKFENQPLVILEAMRAGIPVVSTRVGSIAEQVEHGVSGYLVAPGDVVDLEARMKELCLRADERARMGAAGRRIFLEKYSHPRFDQRWRLFLKGQERPANDVGIKQS
jgi:glycosyltransferase involved in cell wall biosynthesis